MQINVRKHHNVGFGFPLNHYIRHTKDSRGMEYLKYLFCDFIHINCKKVLKKYLLCIIKSLYKLYALTILYIY